MHKGRVTGKAVSRDMGSGKAGHQDASNGKCLVLVKTLLSPLPPSTHTHTPSPYITKSCRLLSASSILTTSMSHCIICRHIYYYRLYLPQLLPSGLSYLTSPFIQPSHQTKSSSFTAHATCSTVFP
ncbi:hypothetical protein Pmani_009991 [Petrolisthes manimaculis]|uniref:Uncharacterized protein n=1 Tax=Petrolisthes manimaculis TaxID=1843537 RepID=A0AAE1Q402_9EUCA|nr:hypothetical protein Pmani_009991 [Petrolisthes manimaculis]